MTARTAPLTPAATGIEHPRDARRHRPRGWVRSASNGAAAATARAVIMVVTTWLSSVDVGGATDLAAPTTRWFGIRVVDDKTGRGVPLVELETVNHLRFVTDSAGWVAFQEPGLMNTPVFFNVRSHGYAFAKDGFGYAGRTLTPVPGGRATIPIRRINVAERLYRITGEGLYRDSVLLGERTPLADPLCPGLVAGQDSTMVTPYRGKLFWFWGDTARMKYPLGHFRTAGATSDLPGPTGLDPATGVNLRYFVDQDGFSRPVAGLGVETGLIWIDGVLTLPDDQGKERLIAHYAHMESLAKTLDHGLAVFNDERQEFERLRPLELSNTWRFPHGHPVRQRDANGDFFLFGDAFPNVRVRAEWKAVLDPARYEAWRPPRSPESGAVGWQPDAEPWSPTNEQAAIRNGAMPGDQTWFLPVDVDGGKPVVMHRGSVRWNPHRQRWILVAVQQGGTSYLGEVWYAEAAEPTGPWRRTKKIVTHDRYTFYNPVHHDFFDQNGGSVIYFEGTYANTFSGNPESTPRYDYNQIMYRLDLDDPRLKPAQP